MQSDVSSLRRLSYRVLNLVSNAGIDLKSIESNLSHGLWVDVFLERDWEGRNGHPNHEGDDRRVHWMVTGSLVRGVLVCSARLVSYCTHPASSSPLSARERTGERSREDGDLPVWFVTESRGASLGPDDAVPW